MACLGHGRVAASVCGAMMDGEAKTLEALSAAYDALSVAYGKAASKKYFDFERVMYSPYFIGALVLCAGGIAYSLYQDTPQQQAKHDEENRVSKEERTRLLMPQYDRLAAGYIKAVRASGVCATAPDLTYDCDFDPGALFLKTNVTTNGFTLSVLPYIRDNGHDTIEAEMRLENQNDIDFEGGNKIVSDTFTNVIKPLLAAFRVDAATGLDTLRKCKAQSRPEPGNWLNIMTGDTRIVCQFYGPNYHNFGQTRFFVLALYLPFQKPSKADHDAAAATLASEKAAADAARIPNWLLEPAGVAPRAAVLDGETYPLQRHEGIAWKSYYSVIRTPSKISNKHVIVNGCMNRPRTDDLFVGGNFCFLETDGVTSLHNGVVTIGKIPFMVLIKGTTLKFDDGKDIGPSMTKCEAINYPKDITINQRCF